MLTRRVTSVTALGCTTAFLLLAVVVALGWTGGVDAVGRPATAWADSHGLVPALRFVEVAFASTAMTVYVALLAVVLLALRAVVQAVFAVVTPVVTSIATGLLKTLDGRPRPPWQLGDHALSSLSFPSGHASAAAALMGTLLVVVASWPTAAGRPRARRAALATTVAVAVVVLAVVAADRVLLGRHYPSDVLGGLLLGAATSSGLALALRLPRTSARVPD